MDRRWCVHTLVRPSDHLERFKWTDDGVSTHWSDLDHLTMNGSNGQTMVCPHTGQTFGSSHDERFKWTDDGVSTHWSDHLTWFKWTDDGVSTHWSDHLTMNGSNGQTMVCPHTGQTFGSSHDELVQMDRRWCVHTLVRPSDHLTMNGSNGQTMVCPHTGQTFGSSHDELVQMDRRWCVHTLVRPSDHLTMNWFKWTH